MEIPVSNIALLIKDGHHYCTMSELSPQIPELYEKYFGLEDELRDYSGIHRRLQSQADDLLRNYPDRNPDDVYQSLMNTQGGSNLISIKKCLKDEYHYDVSKLPIIVTPEFPTSVILVITSIALFASIVLSRKYFIKF